MIIRLGHVQLVVDDLTAARAFYVDLLGFTEASSADGRLYLRASAEFDLWSLALVEGREPGLGHLAFRVEDPSDLDLLEEIHRRRNLPCERVAAGAEPGQGDALRALTPDAHPVEFYHSFQEIEASTPTSVRLPMRNTHREHGVPPVRIDHVNLRVTDVPAALAYWVDDLAFGPSEMWLEDDESIRVAWLRRTYAKTHDVAVGKAELSGFHHLAYTVADQQALLRTADLLGDSGHIADLEYGPSRHGATNAFCMYVRDPAGLRLELFCGDYARDLDRPAVRWSAAAYAAQGHSWWGQPPAPEFRVATPLRTATWPEVTT